MKSINHKKLITLSRQTGVSIHLLTRREMNYRKITVKEKLKESHCLHCKAHDTPLYDGVNRDQCHFIGIGNDQHADVNENHICDFYTVSEYKIKLKEQKE